MIRLDSVVDPISDATALSQAISGVAAAGGTLMHTAQAVPKGMKASPAATDVRREAYLALQEAVWRCVTQALLLREIAAMTSRPLIAGRPRDPFGHVLAAMTKCDETLVDLLSAMSRVRMVGNPAPRAAAEQLLMMTNKLFENLGVQGPRAKKDAERATFAEWQLRIGHAQKQLTEICREDLGLTRPVREKWWQLRRPKAPEPWPGGWPGKLEGDGEEESPTS